jgi:RNA recognition motif-containing protein
MKSLYVGKLPHQATEDDLQEWFGQAGFRVKKVTLIRDLFSRQSRGFGSLKLPTMKKPSGPYGPWTAKFSSAAAW